VRDDVHVDSDVLLVTDFVNLKIKSTQYFRGAYRDRVYIHVFIEINIRVYFLKKDYSNRDKKQLNKPPLPIVFIDRNQSEQRLPQSSGRTC
jgi:hypothetical protein